MKLPNVEYNFTTSVEHLSHKDMVKIYAELMGSRYHKNWWIKSYQDNSKKSIGTLKRNVVNPLKQICETIGYEVVEHRSENFLEIRDGDKVNFVYLFGGKDNWFVVQFGNILYYNREKSEEVFI